MSPKYTLIYFNGRGYAELTRLLFAKANVHYEDKRVEKDNWPELKNEMPFGHLPVLVLENGVQISESRTIARYIAREHGLAGKNAIESAQADAVVDYMYDVALTLVPFRRETDPEKKKELLLTFVNEGLPLFCKNIEKTLSKTGSGFLVGDNVTWADIAVAGFIWQLNNYIPDAMASQKDLAAFEKKINSIPEIKQWMETRPQTEF